MTIDATTGQEPGTETDDGFIVDEFGRRRPKDLWTWYASDDFNRRERQVAQPEVGVGGMFKNLVEVILHYIKAFFTRDFSEAEHFANAYGLSNDSWGAVRTAITTGFSARVGGASTNESLDAALRTFTDNNSESLLRLIRDVEAGGSYNVANGNRQVNFTGMTINGVKAWQANTNHGGNSPAAGAYQIMPDTLKIAIQIANKDGGPIITGNELFDEAMQDRLARALLVRRGINEFRNGSMTGRQFMDNLALEWAALPKENNLSAYHGIQGNKAGLTTEEFISRSRAKPTAQTDRSRQTSSLPDHYRNAADPAAEITGSPREQYASNAASHSSYGAPKIDPLAPAPETGPRPA